MGVGFGLTNDLPYLLFVGLFFDQRDRRSKFDGVARKFGDIDYFGPRKLILKLVNARLVEFLLSWQLGIQSFPLSWYHQRSLLESFE
jgi:hypothetical protein